MITFWLISLKCLLFLSLACFLINRHIVFCAKVIILILSSHQCKLMKMLLAESNFRNVYGFETVLTYFMLMRPGGCHIQKGSSVTIIRAESFEFFILAYIF